MSNDGKDSGDTTDGAPIDFDRLDVIRERLAADSRFDRVDDQRIFASERLAGIEGGKPPSSRSERRVAS